MNDRGAATLLVLALGAVLALVGAVLTTGFVAVAARSRAAAAADLAALAAAGRAHAGSGAACSAAAALARDNGAELSGCTLAGRSVRVAVAVPLPGGLEPFGPARASARAERVPLGTRGLLRSSDRGAGAP